MTLSTTVRALAKNAISKYGKTITLVRVIEGVYDPATSETVNTETIETIKAIVEDFGGKELVAGMIERGDKKITYASSAAEELRLADRVIVDSIGYSVLNVETVYAIEEAAIYVIQARRA